MKDKMSGLFSGTCESCKKKTNVFDVYDEESKKTTTMCEECSKKSSIVKVKMSAMFEGKCDLCKESKNVIRFGDEDSRKVVTICMDCASGMSETRPEELIQKYGKVDEEPFKQAVKIEGKMIGG